MRLERLQRRLQSKIKEGLRGESVRTALDILEGRGQVPEKVLQELLELAAVRPGPEPFAQTVMLCVAAKLKLDIPAYAKVLGLLVQRDAPVAQLRVILNLVLPKGAKPVPVAPPDMEQEDAAAMFEDEGAGDQSDVDDREADRAGPPGRVEMTRCRAYPDFNGVYELDGEVTSFGRPTYERTSEPKAVLYYRSYAKDAKETGWWLSRHFDGDPVAFNPRESRRPPRGGWQAILGNARQPDPMLVEALANGAAEGQSSSRPSRVSATAAAKALERIDLRELQGMVSHRDQLVLEYFGHFCVLMHLEFLAEVSSIRRRRQRSSADQLVRTGWALDGLPVKSVFGRRDGAGGNKKPLPGWQDLGSEMVAFMLPRGFDSERCRFARGECVTLSEQDPLRDRVAEGSVTSVTSTTLVVQLSGKMPEGRGRAWRLDKSANRVTYERQLAALLQLASAGKLPTCCELLVAGKVGGVDAWVEEMSGRGGGGGGGGALRHENGKNGAARDERGRSRSRSGSAGSGKKEGRGHKNGKSGKPVSRAAQLALETPRDFDPSRLERALKEVEKLEGLNKSQRDAVAAAMERTCTIIQGPPGTGKTHVSVQVLRLWAKCLGAGPLLAASDSNIAVDNIAAGLHSKGVKVVRLGRPEKVRGYLEDITLEAQLQQAKLRREREQEERDRRADDSGSDGRDSRDGRTPRNSNGKSGGKGGKGRFGRSGSGGNMDAELEHEMRRMNSRMDFELQLKIMKEAEVVATTTISAGGDFLSKLHFGGILIDEVAQATELSAIVPIVLRGSNNLKRMAFVGDHCQLPPGIASKEAEMRGLSLSIYGRLQKAGIEPVFLDTQYRSNPKIMEFSSEAFYNGALRSGVDAKARPPPKGVSWPNRDVPVAFVEVGAPEESEGDSKFNTVEAQHVLQLVREVLQARELTLADIGVVTPYVAQVRRLRQMLRPMIPPGTDPRNLEIASVDAFQGREKELMIFSAVRCNPASNVGFLADWRRLNVMLTRARRGLVVFGASATLRSDSAWERWLAWCEKNGSVRGKVSLGVPRGLEASSRRDHDENAGSGSSRALFAAAGGSRRGSKRARSSSSSSRSRSSSSSRSARGGGASKGTSSAAAPAPSLARKRSGWDESSAAAAPSGGATAEVPALAAASGAEALARSAGAALLLAGARALSEKSAPAAAAPLGSVPKPMVPPQLLRSASAPGAAAGPGTLGALLRCPGVL